jgi:hypothetical protein
MNYKIRIDNENHSEKVHQVLFKLGYTRFGFGVLRYPKKPFLYTHNMKIIYGISENRFKSDPKKEITLAELENILNSRKQDFLIKCL